MHEVGITKGLVDSLQQRIKDKEDVKSVARVSVNLGRDLAISEESLKFWFAHFSKGTKLENTQVSVNFIDGRLLVVDSLEVD